ncbi:16S rRNA pseudouridine(516) synthase [Prosthecobacter sp.]|uniref:16S rRNA pseudouridine(516) synthase n=1 Tax=Prosthecobacter sp. TaxID=1965333 RepID=UPI003784B149
MKLDRLIASHQSMGRQAAHRAIAARRVRVDGVCVTDGHHPVDRFTLVELDEAAIRQPERSLYIMLHKPAGVLSATKDAQHRTVIDLIDHPEKHTLHIAGRLDRSTSGLVLLTNDGRWSKRLMMAEEKVPKVYRVETQDPIAPEAVEAFARGFYFHTEDITTLPAELVILGARHARLTLHEGRYHQVKRMFHRVRNRVLTLHRESIGTLALASDLPSGSWRHLTPHEVLTAAK